MPDPHPMCGCHDGGEPPGYSRIWLKGGPWDGRHSTIADGAIQKELHWIPDGYPTPRPGEPDPPGTIYLGYYDRQGDWHGTDAWDNIEADRWAPRPWAPDDDDGPDPGEPWRGS